MYILQDKFVTPSPKYLPFHVPSKLWFLVPLKYIYIPPSSSNHSVIVVCIVWRSRYLGIRAYNDLCNPYISIVKCWYQIHWYGSYLALNGICWCRYFGIVYLEILKFNSCRKIIHFIEIKQLQDEYLNTQLFLKIEW